MASNSFVTVDMKHPVDSKLDLNICNNSVLRERTIRDMAEIATKTTSSEKQEAKIQAVHQRRQKANMN